MNGTRARRRLRAALALTTGLVGLSALAPAGAAAATDPESYSLTVLSAGAAGGSADTFTLRLGNPAGNSDPLGSASFEVPAGLKLTSASLGGTGRIFTTDDDIFVGGLNLAPGGTVDITVHTDAASSCTPQTYKWDSWASEPGEGDEGDDRERGEPLSLAPGSVTTSVVADTCSVKFGVEPHNAKTGNPLSGVDWTPGTPVTAFFLLLYGIPVRGSVRLSVSV